MAFRGGGRKRVVETVRRGTGINHFKGLQPLEGFLQQRFKETKKDLRGF